MPISVTLITPPATDDTSVTPTLDDAAAQPKRVSIDNQSVEAHSLPDQIEYDKYKAAKNRRGVGIQLFKIRPPSAADVDLSDNTLR